MENEITAHKAGTVAALPIAVGASVATGDVLAVIESRDDATVLAARGGRPSAERRRAPARSRSATGSEPDAAERRVDRGLGRAPARRPRTPSTCSPASSAARRPCGRLPAALPPLGLDRHARLLARGPLRRGERRPRQGVGARARRAPPASAPARAARGGSSSTPTRTTTPRSPSTSRSASRAASKAHGHLQGRDVFMGRPLYGPEPRAAFDVGGVQAALLGVAPARRQRRGGGPSAAQRLEVGAVLAPAAPARRPASIGPPWPGTTCAAALDERLEPRERRQVAVDATPPASGSRPARGSRRRRAPRPRRSRSPSRRRCGRRRDAARARARRGRSSRAPAAPRASRARAAPGARGSGARRSRAAPAGPRRGARAAARRSSPRRRARLPGNASRPSRWSQSPCVASRPLNGKPRLLEQRRQQLELVGKHRRVDQERLVAAAHQRRRRPPDAALDDDHVLVDADRAHGATR